jgi:hypothetical protein
MFEMSKRWFAATIACLWLASAVPADAATVTNVVSLSSTTYTDLGPGPILLGAVGGNVIYQVADSQPANNSGGHVQRFGDPPAPVQTTSHIWALGANGASAVVSSGAVGAAAASVESLTPSKSASPYTAQTVGTSDVTILAANAVTNYLDVISGSPSATVCINFGAAATITGTQCAAGEITLPPLWHRSWPDGGTLVPTGAVHAIASAASTPVSVGAN